MEASKPSRPAWMEDELVKDIEERKLQFLEQMFVGGHGKSQKEMMTYVLPMMKKAKEENLAFTPQEMTVAIQAIKKHSTEEELDKINKILEKRKK